MLFENLFSFEWLIKTFAIHQLIDSAKQNYLTRNCQQEETRRTAKEEFTIWKK